MATLLDVGILTHIGIIFPLLLVFFVVYAVLETTKIFGENKGIHAVIGFCCAFLLLLSPNLMAVIQTITPWFVFAIMMLLFFLVILSFTGYKYETIIEDMSKSWGTPHWFLLIIFIIFVVGGLSSVYGNTAFLPLTDENGEPRNASETGSLSTDTGEFTSNVGRTMFHPKILGLIIILVIFSFAIRLIALP